MNFRKKIAIDLGTTSILVYSRKDGVILKEPSVVAIDRYTDKIVAVGKEAKDMLGRTPGNIMALRPMRDGIIVDYSSTEKMLKYFIDKAIGKTLFKPEVIICVPSGATQVQKRAVMQAAIKSGAHDTFLIEEPLAAAIGAGIDIADPGGSMIIDIGGGTTDVAVISLGGIVVGDSIRVAGDQCDQAIVDFIRNEHNIIIGEKTAEDLKISISEEDSDKKVISVKGRNLDNGLPSEALVSPNDLEKALDPVIKKIINSVHKVLNNTPPELAADLFEEGAIMTGGGALVRHLDKKIEDSIGIKVTIAENPISAVVRGTGRSLRWIDRLQGLNDSESEIMREQLAKRERLRRR